MLIDGSLRVLRPGRASKISYCIIILKNRTYLAAAIEAGYRQMCAVYKNDDKIA